MKRLVKVSSDVSGWYCHNIRWMTSLSSSVMGLNSGNSGFIRLIIYIIFPLFTKPRDVLDRLRRHSLDKNVDSLLFFDNSGTGEGSGSERREKKSRRFFAVKWGACVTSW